MINIIYGGIIILMLFNVIKYVIKTSVNYYKMARYIETLAHDDEPKLFE